MLNRVIVVLLAQRVALTQGWSSILLFDADGRGVLHTGLPLGAPLPSPTRSDALFRARDERRPAVSNLFDGMQQRRIVAVYIPIVRDGIVRYVLSAALPASRFGEVLRAQAMASTHGIRARASACRMPVEPPG